MHMHMFDPLRVTIKRQKPTLLECDLFVEQEVFSFPVASHSVLVFKGIDGWGSE